MASEPTNDTLEMGTLHPRSRAALTSAAQPWYAPVQSTTSGPACSSALTAGVTSSSNPAPRG